MKYAWIDEAPFNFMYGGRLTGCDVELARYLFDMIGEPFDPVETEFSQLLAGLRDGRWDVTPGMFITPERMRQAWFTTPTWALRDGLLVRHEDAGSLDGYRSIAARSLRLAVLERQVQHQTALRLGVAPDRIRVFRSYAEAANAVLDGEVDAYASVARAHETHLAHIGTGRFGVVEVPASERLPQRGAFACRTESIRDRIDGVLQAYLGTPDHRTMAIRMGLQLGELV